MFNVGKKCIINRSSSRLIRYNSSKNNKSDDKLGGFDLNNLFKRLDIASELENAPKQQSKSSSAETRTNDFSRKRDNQPRSRDNRKRLTDEQYKEFKELTKHSFIPQAEFIPLMEQFAAGGKEAIKELLPKQSDQIRSSRVTRKERLTDEQLKEFKELTSHKFIPKPEYIKLMELFAKGGKEAIEEFLLPKENDAVFESTKMHETKPFNLNNFKDLESRKKDSFRYNRSENNENKSQTAFKRTTTSSRKPFVKKRDDAKPPISPPIESKSLSSAPFTPKIIPEDFFHNKIPTVQSTISQRFSSISKLALLESNFPFRLPKEVIEKAPKSTRSKFILSKSSWNLTPNATKLSDRLKTMYYGQIPQLNTDGVSTGELSTVTSSYLNNNGNLQLQQKQSMFDIINGKVNLKTIFKDAHWKKIQPKKAKVVETKAAPTQGKKKGKK
ncbi:unnamed protein product [Candida verbasci]|uniref:Uncharacterized protein n=1 Tax=Candida verbasci TaxID=1227364 RepID=A0A9W4TW81_9ASCO|nr:unnamed protein product [Candida verbasci]